MSLTNILIIVQMVFGVIIGLYFWNLLKSQRTTKVSVDRESHKEIEKLRKMRSISLTVPLSEKVRPTTFDDIVGQEEGIKALKAALCGPNPQHVIIYGPPGVGKTAAARLVLEYAKKAGKSPFRQDAVFVELDATTARFDERGIADPLIGSVHDPIYQGAGALGQAGVPQPKKGAVTDAHGGILFIDEIGELHPIQINKLLKVLEDRRVMLESAYYSEENNNIPSYIHDIFKNGLPADFRMVGATTRSPEDIPPAIRSRCIEVFFRELENDEIQTIAHHATVKVGLEIEDEGLKLVSEYARNGREALNLIQIAAGMAITEEKEKISATDLRWIIEASQLVPKYMKFVRPQSEIGVVNGLAVYGPNSGALLDIEVTAIKADEKGSINVTGIVEEESIGGQGKSIRRKSMAKGSLENVLTVLRAEGLLRNEYHIHVNFPGGAPVDGPSAGIAMATGIFSAIRKLAVDHEVAMTGELGIHGDVKPVGGVYAKVLAAKKAGAKRIIVPVENMKSIIRDIEGIEIIPVSHIRQVIHYAFERSVLESELKEQNRYFVQIDMDDAQSL